MKVHGRPLLSVGDRVMLAVSVAPGGRPGMAMMATFGQYVAIQDSTWGGSPLALDGARKPITDFGPAGARTTHFDAVDDTTLAAECDVEDELLAPPLVTWDALRERWMSLLDEAEQDEAYNVGQTFAAPATGVEP